MATDEERGDRIVSELAGTELVRAAEIYASIHFQASEPSRDRTFGVFEGEALVGLGRIQRHADGELEVGGFWIAASRRGSGLARSIVEQVLARVPPGRAAWCIPFEYLTDFYLSFGMCEVDAVDAPESIRAKLGLCRRLHDDGHYAPVRLLRYTAPE